MPCPLNDRTKGTVLHFDPSFTAHTVKTPKKPIRIILLFDRLKSWVIRSPERPLPIRFVRVCLSIELEPETKLETLEVR